MGPDIMGPDIMGIGAGLRRALRAGLRRAVEAGLPPRAAGWRQVRRIGSEAYLAAGPGRDGDRGETLHGPARAQNPLPCNVADRAALDPDPGWWGFAFRDVPERANGPTRLLHLEHARIVTYGGPGTGEKFHPAILTRDDRALEIDQIVFRPPHGAILRRRPAPDRRARATWILERVYDNHSHWLTAHLPKLVLLRARGMAGDVLLPRRLTPVMERSIRMLGLDPERFPRFEPGGVLAVEALTVVQSDRFRPELLRPVREALAPAGSAPRRRVFVSRARSAGRRLTGEETLWAALARRGFERVFMEALDFAAQVRLMADTAVLVAPHGAGLTNMMFCPPGTQVVEIADRAYPNPNFYALAVAMGLGYWLVHAEGIGAGHALTRDLAVAPEAVLAAVDGALAAGAAA
jgi:hypothetical protein